MALCSETKAPNSKIGLSRAKNEHRCVVCSQLPLASIVEVLLAAARSLSTSVLLCSIVFLNFHAFNSHLVKIPSEVLLGRFVIIICRRHKSSQLAFSRTRCH
ncbi:hypothetical protein TRVL_08673 [Trypanosoma vivax]|nr:hypothetical protein TRVL_08673 [Trypanosoma vivax]